MQVSQPAKENMAYLLELLDGTLVNTTALVDQVSGGGRLSGVDVADNDDVDMRLLLTHGGVWYLSEIELK